MGDVNDFKALTVGAAAFAIALAWNNAITASIKRVYPEHRIGAHFAYAIGITLLAIIIYVCAMHSIKFANKIGMISDSKSNEPSSAVSSLGITTLRQSKPTGKLGASYTR